MVVIFLPACSSTPGLVPSTLTSTSWCPWSTQYPHRCSTPSSTACGTGRSRRPPQGGAEGSPGPGRHLLGQAPTHPRDPAQTDGTPAAPGDSAGQPKALERRPLHHPQGKGRARAPALWGGATPHALPLQPALWGEPTKGLALGRACPSLRQARFETPAAQLVMAATRTKQMSPERRLSSETMGAPLFKNGCTFKSNVCEAIIVKSRVKILGPWDLSSNHKVSAACQPVAGVLRGAAEAGGRGITPG